MLCAALLATEWWLIQARQSQGLREENRFLTTEWYLLQQLKSQTDAELAEKNQEIDRLKRLYEQLKAQNDSPAELAKVEAELKVAETARGVMLAETAKAGYHPSLEAALPTESHTTKPASTDSLLSQRIKTLESQLEELRLRSEAAEAALAASKRIPTPVAVPAPPPVEPGPTLAQILDRLEEEGTREAVPQATVAELKTRALTRALLNSTDVRRQYPDLLKAFDAYLDAYAAREYARGHREGQAAATETVRQLEK